MAYLKQCIGIDISKDSFTACLCKREYSGGISFSKVASFTNEKTGFNQLLRWVKSESESTVDLVYLMEATGGLL